MSWRGGPDDEKPCAKAGEEFIAATTTTAWSVLEWSMVAVACGRPSIERATQHQRGKLPAVQISERERFGAVHGEVKATNFERRKSEKRSR